MKSLNPKRDNSVFKMFQKNVFYYDIMFISCYIVLVGCIFFVMASIKTNQRQFE